MNMDNAREILQRALSEGLQLHGVSVNGKPAISFDEENPKADIARQRFSSTQGLIRDLLRAAMIAECIKRGLPEDLTLPSAYMMAERLLGTGARIIH
jgi:hypothetical protein